MTWIKTSDRVPERSGHVLGLWFFPGEGTEDHYVVQFSVPDGTWRDGGDFDEHVNPPTHWMPLPEGPR